MQVIIPPRKGSLNAVTADATVKTVLSIPEMGMCVSYNFVLLLSESTVSLDMLEWNGLNESQFCLPYVKLLLKDVEQAKVLKLDFLKQFFPIEANDSERCILTKKNYKSCLLWNILLSCFPFLNQTPLAVYLPFN